MKHLIFVLSTILITLAIFLSLEGLFRAFKPRPETTFFIPSHESDVLISNLRHFDPDGTYSVNDQKIALQPDRNVKRIFLIGESTIVGLHFNPHAHLGKWLDMLLKDAVPDQKFEVVNAGVSGSNSFDILKIYQEVLAFKPSLIVVYAGQNEFLEPNIRRYARQSALHDLQAHLKRRSVAIFWLFYKLGQRSFVSTSPSYENAWTHEPIYGEHLSSITRGFEDNLRNMVRLGRSHGVPTLLITPVANLRDWEPNFSFFQKSTDPDLQREFLDQLDQGKQLLERGELVEAKTIFARLLVVEPGFAELQFSYGRLLEAQELYPEARSAYEQAAQFDGRPWRNLPEFAPLIREISAQEDTFLVDANSLFERESPHGLVGRNLIIDNCHPSLHGQFLIAREILVVLRAEQFLETVENEQIRTEEQYLRRLFPSTEARAESSYRTGSYVLTWVTLRKDPRLRLQQALADFDQALQYWPRYPEALYARAMTLKALGQSDLARQSEGLAFQLDPEIDRKAEHVTRLLSPMMRQ